MHVWNCCLPHKTNFQGSCSDLNSWQSLEICPTNFQIWIKSGKSSVFFQSYKKCFRNEFFFLFWYNLIIQSRLFSLFAAHHEISFVSAFLRSLLITYLIILSVENKLFWKKSWILYPKICTEHELFFFFLRSCYHRRYGCTSFQKILYLEGRWCELRKQKFYFTLYRNNLF